MKRLLILILFLMFRTPVWAEDLYVGQSVAGDESGSSCANQQSAVWFNTAGSWGAGAGKISAGDTVHLCGTITTGLIAQASGSSGSPITIYFETGANVTSASAFGEGGAIDVRNLAYIIIDGGPICGYVNRVDTVCNGSVKNTAGPAGDFPLINGGGCSNCEFKNLEVHQPGGYGIGNLQGGIPAGATWKVYNCVFHEVATGIPYIPSSSGENGFQAYNNWFYGNNSGVDISNNNNGTIVLALIHDNHFGSTAIHDDDGCPSHHNSLHAFAKTTTNSGIKYYNNLVDGDWGNCATSLLFIEGGEYGNNLNIQVYNNLFLPDFYTQMNNGIVSVNGNGGLLEVYNNTIVGLAVSGDICFGSLGDGVSSILKFKNNILGNCATIFYYKDITLSDVDYNIYQGASGNPWTKQTTPAAWYSTIGDWRTACSCDANSFDNDDPGYAKVTATGTIPTDSPAKDAGTSISSIFTTDHWGISRPQGVAWDIGAYEYFIKSGIQGGNVFGGGIR